MSQAYDSRAQQAFAASVCRVLRESRRRQKLTQAEVAQRTGGLVSKAALANYETGHRSLRVDVLWVIAGALGEDLGVLLTKAESGIGVRPAFGASGPLTVQLDDVLSSTDPRMAVVKRYFELSARTGQTTTTLDENAIGALAALMNVSPIECRRLLAPAARPGRPVANGFG